MISTPTEVSAKHVDPSLPTIVFLHSLGSGKETFERQFDNPSLRQFNLVAFDLRSFGDTGGTVPKKPWLPADVTEDVFNLIKALKLPPCHFFGLALGAYVAVDLAAKYPHNVLSVTACSPLSAIEPAHVVEGRKQLSDYFVNFALPKALAGSPDEAYADDVILGAIQLLYNVIHMPIVHAIARLSWDYVLRNYTESVDHIDTAFETNVRVFLERQPFTKDHLKKIQCPVTIVHCADDVAYDLRAAEELKHVLDEAAVEVSLKEVPGPHFGCVTHPEAINIVLFDTVISNTPGDTGRFRPLLCDARLETPFRCSLAKYGYQSFEIDDE